MTVFGRIVAAFAGVIFGVWIGLFIATVSLKNRIMKKAAVRLPDGITDGERETIEGIIRERNKAFDKATGKNLFRRIFKVGKADKFPVDYFGIIKEVASAVNPTSKSPLLELSERQIFDFFRDVFKKLRIILDETGVKALKNVELSSVYSSYSLAFGIAKNKAVGAAVKTTNALIRILNFFNPFFWFKKTVTAAVTEKTIRVAAHASVEIVAKEFASLYLDVKNEEFSDEEIS